MRHACFALLTSKEKTMLYIPKGTRTRILTAASAAILGLGACTPTSDNLCASDPGTIACPDAGVMDSAALVIPIASSLSSPSDAGSDSASAAKVDAGAEDAGAKDAGKDDANAPDSAAQDANVDGKEDAALISEDAGKIEDAGPDDRDASATATIDSGSSVADPPPCSGVMALGECLVTLSDSEIAPASLVVAQDRVFWVNSKNGSGSVRSVGLDGGGLATLASTSLPLKPSMGIAYSIAADSSHLYWANLYSQSILRSDFDGGSVTTLATTEDAPLGITAFGDRIAWTTNGNTGAVFSAPTDGGTVTTLATGETLYYAIAANSSEVVWTNRDTATLKAAPLDGGAVSTMTYGPAYEATGAMWQTLALNSTGAYWSTSDGIYTNPLDGGASSVVVKDSNIPGALAVDEAHLYWFNHQGDILRTTLTGASLTTIATGQPDVSGLTLDDASVYWTTNVSDFAPGSIMKATPK
jgi:sugar lactone lactonase YvrE